MKPIAKSRFNEKHLLTSEFVRGKRSWRTDSTGSGGNNEFASAGYICI